MLSLEYVIAFTENALTTACQVQVLIPGEYGLQQCIIHLFKERGVWYCISIDGILAVFE